MTTQGQEYRDRWAISNSMIKCFRHMSPKKWKRIFIDNGTDEDKNDDTFVEGTLLDIISFTPDKLGEHFYIAEQDKLPSKAISSIVKSVYDAIVRYNSETEELNLELPEPMLIRTLDLSTNIDFLLKYANEYKEKAEDNAGWQMNWKEATRIDKILEQGTAYFNLLKIANGRKIITSDANMLAIELKDILYSDENTKDYFISSEMNEVLHQVEIFIDYKLSDGTIVPRKGQLDGLRIDHNAKTIQIFDLKRMQSAFGFLEAIKKYGYCDQLSYYYDLVYFWAQDYKDGILKDYELIMPINIVIDNRDKVPYIYEYNFDDLVEAKKAYFPILEDINWHMTTDQWNKPRELYLNGKIKVNLTN